MDLQKVVLQSLSTICNHWWARHTVSSLHIYILFMAKKNLITVMEVAPKLDPITDHWLKLNSDETEVQVSTRRSNDATTVCHSWQLHPSDTAESSTVKATFLSVSGWYLRNWFETGKGIPSKAQGQQMYVVCFSHHIFSEMDEQGVYLSFKSNSRF